MKPAQTTSPFKSLSKQEQREKWNAWQSTHMEETELTDEESIAQKPLPPLKLPTVQEEKAAFAPRHSQYDAVLSRMKKASESVRYIDT